MKTKLIIEKGETTILLTPENDFETDIIEKIVSKREKYDHQTFIEANSSYGTFSKHKIEIIIKEKAQ